ncbi:ComEC/Rec2 family competence protein [Alkalicoccobacillus gibsonii]|uniref:ComEC/Rec2 family competence protein n=1 Tax=Alkalicoccobacillus gibsonii TaxID=79881 RepID=UPI00235E2999|nr:ComEC/Rec2 family competence protein [Alkalicoccobacillus gibsonii]
MKNSRMIGMSLFAVICLTACSEGEFFELLDGVFEETATNAADAPRDSTRTAASAVDGEASVTIFDVGQGDSALVQSDDTTILIDTGRHDSDVIFDHLSFEEIDQIDLLILTHPHADHIGNADEIVRIYNPHTVWIDGNETTSQVFERLVDSLLESDAEVIEPIAGESYEQGEFLIDVLNPSEELTGDLNNDSVSIKLTYGEVSFLFTGDAEEPGEHLMVDSGMDLKSEVLIMGHHGSNTSSNDFFLDEVQPDIAIYSAGENNSYGHPGEYALTRVEDVGADVFGTIENGTITIRTDGQIVNVETEF